MKKSERAKRKRQAGQAGQPAENRPAEKGRTDARHSGKGAGEADPGATGPAAPPAARGKPADETRSEAAGAGHDGAAATAAGKSGKEGAGTADARRETPEGAVAARRSASDAAFTDGNKRRFYLAIGLAVAIFAVLIFDGVLVANPPEPTYGLIGKNLKVAGMPARDEPLLSDDAVRAWARSRAVAMYNMNFRNYEDRLDRLRRDFTADGWTSLQASLGPFRAQFESFPLFQSAVAEQPPVITVSGRLRGRKIWKVEVPVRVTARFSGRETSRSMLVRMEIVKADPAIRPEALRIARYVSG